MSHIILNGSLISWLKAEREQLYLNFSNFELVNDRPFFLKKGYIKYARIKKKHQIFTIIDESHKPTKSLQPLRTI